MNGRPRRVCFVVQRYGRDVVGGAERHCRLVAERLAGRYDVTVLTTCAHDYLTWANHYPPGETVEGGVRVIRFPVARTRRVRSFGRLSTRLYRRPHPSPRRSSGWSARAPTPPDCWPTWPARRDEHDLFVFFTYLYATTFLGLPLVADRALMIPTAHPEEPLAFGIFRYLFPLVRGFIFNTPEERDLVFGRFRCGHVPHTIVGVGVDLPPVAGARAARPGADPSLLYVGRHRRGQGDTRADRLLPRLARRPRPGRRLRLLLAGEEKMRLPRHPDIVRTGVRHRRDAHAAPGRGHGHDRPVAAREPVDDRAGGLGRRRPGAGQRPLGGPRRAVRALRRGARLRRARRIRPTPSTACWTSRA